VIRYLVHIVLVLLIASVSLAKDGSRTSLTGIITDDKAHEPLVGARIDLLDLKSRTVADSTGRFTFSNIPEGWHVIKVTLGGFQTLIDSVEVLDSMSLELAMKSESAKGEDITVTAERRRGNGMSFMPAVQGTAIYEGKKNEVILVSQLDANRATNNTRQIFSKVPGINVIENDGGGIQLGVAVRGLNPNRITEFNSRQNGYDISADALGYPESYYTPPMEGLRRIEVVRGAASLQYGSQFGGLLNFVMQEGPLNKKYEINTVQTGGSFGFFNSYNSIGGQLGDLNYFGFYHRKQADGWRNNSNYAINTGYANAKYQVGEKMALGFELTMMHYDMQQPGGLTEEQFAQDPQQSNRERNWFNADWKLPALTLDYNFSATTRFNSRFFALIADRSSIGNLTAPNKPDVLTSRDLIRDDYENYGVEARFVHTYEIFGGVSTALAGVRYYKGNTHRRQGLGFNGDDANFEFLNPGDLEASDYRFPTTNAAVFAENIVLITPALSITPGVRYEFISTNAKGYYKLNGENRFEERLSERSFPLFGIGASYHVSSDANLYANVSQAYSGVNFNDMRVVNPNFQVDSNLRDVTGYNFDFGFRGRLFDRVAFDIGGFYLRYNDRVGVVNKADEQFNVYRYRTNVSDSRSYGIESFVELDVWGIIDPMSEASISVFNSFAYVDAKYINSEFRGVLNKRVEYAPEIITRSGITYKLATFSATAQLSYVSDQYTDATNTKYTKNAINGLIPAYTVVDLSATYRYDIFTFTGGINNLLDEKYYTRRADGYPGPGILPADGRGFFLSAGVRL
jgi:Fe(3+) dicitrate transport protein